MSYDQRSINTLNKKISKVIRTSPNKRNLNGSIIFKKTIYSGKSVLLTLLPLLVVTTLSACNNDNDNSTAMVKAPTKTLYTTVNFDPVGSYIHGGFGESAAEIIAFHPKSKRAFVVNSQNKKIRCFRLTKHS